IQMISRKVIFCFRSSSPYNLRNTRTIFLFSFIVFPSVFCRLCPIIALCCNNGKYRRSENRRYHNLYLLFFAGCLPGSSCYFFFFPPKKPFLSCFSCFSCFSGSV